MRRPVVLSRVIKTNEVIAWRNHAPDVAALAAVTWQAGPRKVAGKMLPAVFEANNVIDFVRKKTVFLREQTIFTYPLGAVGN